MHITFVVPTLTRFDLLDRLIKSVNMQTRKPNRIIIIDNSNGKCKQYPKTRIIKVDNIGVAGAWNLGIKNTDENGLLIICNDDNVLNPDAIEELEILAMANKNHPFFSSMNGGFSFFAIRPKLAIETVGYFDEGFYPAYYEDNDYHYRMKLANLEFIYSNRKLYESGINGQVSQTLKGNMTPENVKNYIKAGFTSNQYRYICKWGGLPTKEVYVKPFNYTS